MSIILTNLLGIAPTKIGVMSARTLSSKSVAAANIAALMRLRPDLASNRDLAKATGISPQTINNVLNVNNSISPTLANLDKIAAALRVSTWMLLMPGPHVGKLATEGVERLLNSYARSDDAGRHLISAVAERSLSYTPSAK